MTKEKHQHGNRFVYVVLIFLLFGEGVFATTVRSYIYNREGVKRFADKAYFPAYQNFLRALQEDPLNPEIHLNMALTFEANEEFDKAEQAYKSALKIIPEESSRRFEVLFNLGGVLAHQQKIDEALFTYQAALDLQPDSKEVKNNIELLWQNQGGGGGKDQNQRKKDDQGKQEQPKNGEGKNQEQQKQGQEQKEKKPKPFQSQELTADDVKKILDEIKNQEQAIRAHEYEKNIKEAPRGKDW